MGLVVSANHRIYVSPKGNATGDGSIQRPFQSIQQAVDYAAKLADDEIEILLRGGSYNMYSEPLKSILKNGRINECSLSPIITKKCQSAEGKAFFCQMPKK